MGGIVIYTDKVEGGERVKLLPIILINPKYKNDKGLHEHEYLHVKHWATITIVMFMCLFMLMHWAIALLIGWYAHGLLYTFVDKFRLWSEVQCYRKQLQYSPQHLEHFVKFICEDYDLDVKPDYVRKLLSK